MSFTIVVGGSGLERPSCSVPVVSRGRPWWKEDAKPTWSWRLFCTTKTHPMVPILIWLRSHNYIGD